MEFFLFKKQNFLPSSFDQDSVVKLIQLKKTWSCPEFILIKMYCASQIFCFLNFFQKNRKIEKDLPSSSDEDSVTTCGLNNAEASNLGAVGFCFLAGFQ